MIYILNLYSYTMLINDSLYFVLYGIHSLYFEESSDKLKIMRKGGK